MSTPRPDQTLPGDEPRPVQPIYIPTPLDKLQAIFTLLLKGAAICALLMYSILAQRGCAIVDDVPHPDQTLPGDLTDRPAVPPPAVDNTLPEEETPPTEPAPKQN